MLTFHEQNYRFKKSDNKVNLFHFPSHFPVCHDHIVEFFMNSFINISVKTKRFGEIPLSIYLRYKKSCFCLNIRHCKTEFESYWDSRKALKVLLRSTVVATEGTEVLLRSTEVAPKRTEVLLRIEGCFPSF